MTIFEFTLINPFMSLGVLGDELSFSVWFILFIYSNFAHLKPL